MVDQPIDVVYFLDQEWRISPRRPHIRALAKYARVLCIDAPVTIDTPLRKPRRFIRWLKQRGRLQRVDDSLYSYVPFMLVPYNISFKYPILRGINRRLMRWNARRAAAKLGMKGPVVFIFYPQQAFEAGILGERLLCYEILDEYSGYAGMSGRARLRVRREEKRLLEKADVVFAVSKGLCEEKSKLHPHVYPSYNTTDVAHFMKALDVKTEIPADIAIIPSPRLGFVGNINENMDFELVNRMAGSHPDWSIVLVGKVNGTRHFLRSAGYLKSKRMKNIHYLGWRDFENLPQYLKAFEACLIMDVDTELMRIVHHNKIYQYLAAGKPVVASYSPEIYHNLAPEIRELIAIAADHADFERLVEEALQRDSPGKIRRRIEVAKENSAEKRAEAKIEILKSFLQPRSDRAQPQRKI